VLRNRPLVHRHAHASRATRGVPTPLERLATLKAQTTDTLRSHAPVWRAPSMDSSWHGRIELGNRLPINLRNFLNEQLGWSIRVEPSTIIALDSRPGDALMRDLARAIRRFSSLRSRESWSECVTTLSRLEAEFFRSPAAERCPVILCLRCSCIGAGPLDEHGGPNCMPVNLDSAFVGRSSKSPDGITSNGIIDAVENFRISREAASQPHYDLDCFFCNGQLVFTWRPLPPARLA